MRYLFIVLAVLVAACSPDTEVAKENKMVTGELPYGSWPSPISAASVVEGSRGLGALSYSDGFLYWLESRPAEGGRITIMRWKEGGEPEEVLPAPWNARTRVQEYGGGAVLVANGVVWFSHFDDQRLYRLVPGEEPVAITPAEDLRFAGCALDSPRQRLICIREDHRLPGEPQNTLVALPLTGVSEGEVLFADADFVAAPSLSADGKRIAFVSWRHPNMPWDDTSLWSAAFDAEGKLGGLALHNPGQHESVIDPQWDEAGQLYAISDRDNWWRIYRVDGEQFSPLATGLKNVEVGGPLWQIGTHYYHLLNGGKILARVMNGGVEYAAVIDPATASTRALELNSASIIDMLPRGEHVFVINAAVDRPPALLETPLEGGETTVIRTASDFSVAPEWVPEFQLVSFPSGQDSTAHGIYFPPTNPGAQGPEGSAPPLIVNVHGGPTSVSTAAYRLSRLYWTSRGFALLDLNYRGSTGFGRDYRRALYGQWGVADVEDAVAGAAWLAQQGLADPKRLIISGGSAGGYTTLAAHAFHDTFAAGASYYGISDLEALAGDTHKFESRYLDQVIGPYPARKDLYVARSPINHLQGFKAPLLLLQGLDDPVVPPNQSEMIYEALKASGVPTAYLEFEGESHGFRKAENQIRSLEAELYFYSRVLGFETAEELPPVAITGL